MRFPLPDAPTARLLPALTSPAGLRRWWDPDAGIVGARLAPGLDGPTMALPGGWEEWVAKRFGMSWVAQLGEDGGWIRCTG